MKDLATSSPPTCRNEADSNLGKAQGKLTGGKLILAATTLIAAIASALFGVYVLAEVVNGNVNLVHAVWFGVAVVTVTALWTAL